MVVALTGVVEDVFDGHEVVEVDRCGVFSTSTMSGQATSYRFPPYSQRATTASSRRPCTVTASLVDGLEPVDLLLTAARSSTL